MKIRLLSVSMMLFGVVSYHSVALGQTGLPTGASKIAYFDLHGPILEKPMEDGIMLFGGTVPPSLKDLVQRLKQARDDQEVRGVVLTFEEVQMGFAQMQELRQAIGQVRAADKEVFVHADSLSLGTYLLATAASNISVVPTGDVWLMGFYSESPYLKGLLDWIGVTADMEHIGAYKSAAEPLTRTGPSKEAEEMTNWLLDSLYDSALKMIAESRQITPEKAGKLVDAGPYLAESAIKAGLIDNVEYRQDFVERLRKRYGGDAKFVRNYGHSHSGPQIDLDNPNPFAVFSEIAAIFGGETSKSNRSAVGVVYVDGAISTGREEASPFGGSEGAKSTSIAKALDDAAEDNSVKAVVLRVDSPGGSALASEIIWNATQRVKAKKPFVVSMGNVAGSGGYYVSCGGDVIFAEPTTITASIGVVGGKLVTTEMWNKLGITWKAYQRGSNADMMSGSKPFDEYERGRFKEYMNDVYTIFKQRITDGRGKKLTKPLDEMAGGRVFTGQQALDLGLVDKLGGLYDAVAYAAGQAQVGDYEVRVIPAPKTIFDLFREMMGGGEEEDQTIRIESAGGLFTPQSPLMSSIIPLLKSVSGPQAKAIEQVLDTMRFVDEERVALTMPPLAIRGAW